MTIKAVFFDIDDTLVDHATAMRSATVELHSSVAPGIGLDEFLLSWKGAHTRHYPRFLRGEVTYAESARARVRDAIGCDVPANEAHAIFARYLADYERGWTLFPDVISCLDTLHDVSLGVISNGRSDEQRHKLTNLGIASRFQCVCVSEDIGVAKPDSRIFEIACTKAGVEASDALVRRGPVRTGCLRFSSGGFEKRLAQSTWSCQAGLRRVVGQLFGRLVGNRSCVETETMTKPVLGRWLEMLDGTDH